MSLCFSKLSRYWWQCPFKLPNWYPNHHSHLNEHFPNHHFSRTLPFSMPLDLLQILAWHSYTAFWQHLSCPFRLVLKKLQLMLGQYQKVHHFHNFLLLLLQNQNFSVRFASPIKNGPKNITSYVPNWNQRLPHKSRLLRELHAWCSLD